MTDTMTEQEAYDYLRKAKYARERKATEDALRPRMVKRSTANTWIPRPVLTSEQAREAAESVLSAEEWVDLIREARHTHRNGPDVIDITSGAIDVAPLLEVKS